MAAGDYTIYGRADQPDCGYLQITGQSKASKADLTFTLGFEPTKVMFWTTGAANATVPDTFCYLKATGNAVCWKTTGSTGAVTAETSNEITVSQNASTGSWEVTVPDDLQTNSHYYVVEIWR